MRECYQSLTVRKIIVMHKMTTKTTVKIGRIMAVAGSEAEILAVIESDPDGQGRCIMTGDG